MKVTTVSANVRFSKALGDGQHKTVELAAEAAIDASEDWQEAQSALYTDLGSQLKALWCNGNQQDSTGEAQEQDQQSPREHYCQVHQTDFKKFEKDGRVWYSHKQGKTWCKEK